jgi:hypothetical protein
MYQNDLAQKLETISEPTALTAIHERFERMNSNQQSIVNEIQNKLHLVLSKRVPEKDPHNGGMEKPMDQDFVSAMRRNIDKMDQTMMMLEKVLNHVNSLI